MSNILKNHAKHRYIINTYHLEIVFYTTSGKYCNKYLTPLSTLTVELQVCEFVPVPARLLKTCNYKFHL